MEFTGEYAKYYQDICNRWEKLVAKSKNLDKNNPNIERMKISASNNIKEFNKLVERFNATTFYDVQTRFGTIERKCINGLSYDKNKHDSETITQIKCIFDLEHICYGMTCLCDYNRVTSYEMLEALYREFEKEYKFICKLLHLLFDERVKMNLNTSDVSNYAGKIHHEFEYRKDRHFDHVPKSGNYNYDRYADGIKYGYDEIYKLSLIPIGHRYSCL